MLHNQQHSHAARFHEQRISSVTFTSAHLYGNVYMWVSMARALADSSDFGFLGKQSSQTMDSLPWTLINRRAKFDIASVILSGETVTIQTNKQQTHKQTANDISTPCLLACVDKNILHSKTKQCEF